NELPPAHGPRNWQAVGGASLFLADGRDRQRRARRARRPRNDSLGVGSTWEAFGIPLARVMEAPIPSRTYRPLPPPPAIADEQLRESSRRLREADPPAPEGRQALAAAADRLADALASEDTPRAEAAQLGEAASGLIEAVNRRHSPRLLEAARERLKRAIIAA